jgi:subtilisin family serine protease
MKTLVYLFSILALIFANSMQASVHIIGNDTIYFEEGIYFKIFQADTFYVDTSVIMIQYHNDAEEGDINELEVGYSLSKRHEFIVGFFSYSYDTNQCFLSLLDDLENESIIDQVEPNSSVVFLCDPLEPDDDYIDAQDYIQDIQASTAWSLSTGDDDVIVAIIDSGFDWEHDDLGPGDDNFDNIYLNQGEDSWGTWNDPTTGDQVDGDDVNPFIDDWKGWGEGPGGMSNDVRPYPSNQVGETKWFHGTFIAGIIGAKTNNDNYISGIAGGWNCKGAKILMFKAGVIDNSSTLEILALGFEYAIEFGAHIIEIAWKSSPNQLITQEIQEAYDNGIFIVAAAGNHLPGGSSAIVYPAYLETTFAVGATNSEDYVKTNSNWGEELELCAPGYDMDGIVPDINNGPYYGIKTIEGNTSAASAMVAGTAALMLSIKPDLPRDQIVLLLEESADEVHPETYDYENGDGWAPYIGHGRLNCLNAVCMAMDYGSDIEITEDKIWCGHKAYKKKRLC